MKNHQYVLDVIEERNLKFRSTQTAEISTESGYTKSGRLTALYLEIKKDIKSYINNMFTIYVFENKEVGEVRVQMNSISQFFIKTIQVKKSLRNLEYYKEKIRADKLHIYNVKFKNKEELEQIFNVFQNIL